VCSKGTTTVFKVGREPSRREPSRAPKATAEVPKAPRGVRRGDGVSLSPLREGSVEGAVPPPQKFFFDFFYLKMVSFGAFWVALPRCMLFRATAQESEAEEEALVKDDTLH